MSLSLSNAVSSTVHPATLRAHALTSCGIKYLPRVGLALNRCATFTLCGPVAEAISNITIKAGLGIETLITRGYIVTFHASTYEVVISLSSA